MLDKLSWAGVTPYYFFVNRPVAGNRGFVLTLEEVYHIVEEAKARTSGLGKRVKLCMSHTPGLTSCRGMGKIGTKRRRKRQILFPSTKCRIFLRGTRL
jgi:L-lysine 2,3-aminomutase